LKRTFRSPTVTKPLTDVEWDKMVSDRDRCSVMGEAVRLAIALLWE
jgi:hypothetical protein